MELRQLQYVLEVAKHKSFSKAAQTLYVSQSNISQQINALEAELGVALFKRDHHTVRITPDGVIFCDYAGKILDLVSKIEKDLKPESNEEQAFINLGIYPFFQYMGKAKIIMACQRENPNVIFCSEIIDVDDANQSLKNDNIDFAFLKLRPEDCQSENEYILLNETQQVVMISKKHPLASKEKLGAKELSQLPLLTGKSGTYLHEVMKRVYFERDAELKLVPFMNSFNVHLMMDMVAEGDGITFATEDIACILEDRGIVGIPVDPPVPFNVYLVYSKKKKLTEVQKNFRDYIAAAYGVKK